MDHDADLLGPGEQFANGNPPNDDGKPAFFVGTERAQSENNEAHNAFWHPQLPDAFRSQFVDACLYAEEGERLRLGRELHDSTGQLLLALRLGICRLRQTNEPENRKALLNEIDNTVSQIDQELRTFTFLNYPAELGECGLIGALETLAKGFGKRTGIRTEFRGGCDCPCTGQLAITLLRVAQEALMNVYRHAQATSVQITLAEQNNIVELCIRDDGRGMPPADHHAVVNGVGLRGMRDRSERLGGHFAVRRLKHGTKVIVRVPRIQPDSRAT